MTIKKEITIGAGTKHPLTIPRFGYGTMRLTGEFVWGEPKNRPEALQILRKALGTGIRFFDTADFYGQDVTNRLIAEACFPYPADLVICTKVGAARGADKSWRAFNTPANLRSSIDKNLKTLKLEQLKLVHLRVMPGSARTFKAGWQTMLELQQEGKILHTGLSNVSPAELEIALEMGQVASVENAFGYAQRSSFTQYHQEYRGLQEVFSLCTKHGIPMIPFWSLLTALPEKDKAIAAVAKKHKATAAQINLAWLLHHHDLILPIPGTSQLKHFDENCKAMKIVLTAADMEMLG